MDFGAISWLGVVLGAIAFFGFGAVWYGPVFGSIWMRETGLTEESAADTNMPLVFGGTFLLEVLAGVGLAALIGADATVASGLGIGLGVALVVVIPLLAVLAIYERRSVTLTALNAGYNLVGLVLMGAIIGALQ